jgi:hypothetical protein
VFLNDWRLWLVTPTAFYIVAEPRPFCRTFGVWLGVMLFGAKVGGLGGGETEN